jgi:hypothetical protein
MKKSFIDKGYKAGEEKSTLLMLYIISIGLPYNDENIKKYQNMSVEELKKKLSDLENKQIDVTDETYFTK